MADPYFSSVARQLVGSWPNGSTIFDSSGNFAPVTIGGDARLDSTLVSPLSGPSMRFDGVGDNFVLKNSGSMTFSGDFAVEMFFMAYQTGRQYTTLLSTEAPSAGYTLLLNSTSPSSGNIAVHSQPYGFVNVGSINVMDGHWHYVKWCRSGSDLRLIVDDAVVSIATSTGTHVCAGDAVFAGNALISGRDFLGAIDGVRISNGVSRYDPANLAVPTFTDYSFVAAPGATCVTNLQRLCSAQNTASQLSGIPPSVAASVQALRRDIYFGGAGRVAGVTTVNGVPAAKRVWLQEKASKLVIAQTWSAANGTYEFNNVDPAREYVVFADDHTKVYNAVVSDRVVPA